MKEGGGEGGGEKETEIERETMTMIMVYCSKATGPSQYSMGYKTIHFKTSNVHNIK